MANSFDDVLQLATEAMYEGAQARAIALADSAKVVAQHTQSADDILKASRVQELARLPEGFPQHIRELLLEMSLFPETPVERLTEALRADPGGATLAESMLQGHASLRALAGNTISEVHDQVSRSVPSQLGKAALGAVLAVLFVRLVVALIKEWARHR